jgi:hypothetical protein
MNRIIIAVPADQLTLELRAELAAMGIKVIGHPNVTDTRLLLSHLRVALMMDERSHH